jgi:hypothetical protein
MKEQSNNPQIIKLRPHHLLCLQAFKGLGYSRSFIQKASELSKLLNQKTTLVRVVIRADDLCLACPNLKEEKCLKDNQRVEKLDRTVIEFTNLKLDHLYPASYLKVLIRKTFNPTLIAKICNGCEWLKSGICQNAFN